MERTRGGELDGLQVRVLGPLQVTVDGEGLRVDTRKALAVLAVVGLDGPQRRESLATLLWPESAPDRARGALRRTLSVLGRGLGGRWLIPQQEVALDSDGVWLDVTEVDSLVARVEAHGESADSRCERCVTDLQQVVDLHRGDLLEGFGLRDSPMFDDWRAERSEHVRRRLARVLDQLTGSRLRLGDLDGTLTNLEQWLAIDPLNEHVHTRLMLVHAWRGERAEAMRRYRACVAVLDAELGVAPLPRTTQVYRAILEDRVPPPTWAAKGEPPPAASRETTLPQEPDAWPLVGRDEVLDELLGTCTGPGKVVVIAGEAGVGKSRLAHVLQERLRASGRPVASARCFAGERGLAFGPFVDLLRRLIEGMPRKRFAALPDTTLAELRRLVPAQLAHDEPLPEPAPLDSPGARTVLFSAIWDALAAALADRQPGVLVLDELQAIDPSSVELLGYGLRRLSERAVTVVLCLRAEDSPAELLSLLDDATIAAAARRITLDRLRTDDTVDLVAAVMPDAATGLAARLHAEAEGLPLLLVEYLRLVVDGQVDVSEDGWGLPRGARDLARSRLAGLSGTALQIASAAATVGRSFDLEVVRAASGRSDADVVDGLDELLARRLVRELPGDLGIPRYDFVHDKLRAAIYDSTSLARRKLLHGRIADALAPLVRRDPQRAGGAAAVALHAESAGRERDAAVWHVQAAKHARDLFANEEARSHLEQALALGHPDSWELRLGLGELSILLGDYPEALATLEAAAAKASSDEQLATTEHRIATVHLRLGELALAESHLATARSLIGDRDAATAARIEADLGLLRLRAQRSEDASHHARAALALAERAGDVEGRAQALNLLGVIARHDGDLITAREHLAASAALAERLGDPAAHVAALNNLALASAEAGDIEVALDLQRRAVDRGARRGDRHREAALRNNLADLLHRSGREAEALEALEAAVQLFASIDAAPEPSPEIWKLVDW